MGKPSTYFKLVLDHTQKFWMLKKRRDEITAQMRRVDQMIKAAIAMMPADERDAIQQTTQRINLQSEGLTEAIRNMLFERFEQGKRGDDLWMTATQITEALENSGRFTAYKSNPLISVHGILKRLEKKELNYHEMPDGSRGYRLNAKALAKRIQDKPKTASELLDGIEKQSGIRIQRVKREVEEEEKEE